jgi:hypothetical protein
MNSNKLPTQIIEGAEVRRTLELFHPAGSVFEIRVLPTDQRRGTTSGYFDDAAKAVAALEPLTRNLLYEASGIYFTPNPVIPAARNRAADRFQERAKQTTSDSDIERRRWLLIDFDPVRPSGVSATGGEHGAAIERSWECRKFLTEMGFGDPVHADSGNGAHLSYRIDLPNDAESRALIERCLASLDFQFSDNFVAVDKTTFNAARIWKLYGTLARKGDSTPERPHRMAKILPSPEASATASEELPF